ncbi:Uncharacterized conserved protein [Kingella potus]|uniref:Uncharacterized conserved protein n=1 Tax=Kingella potus TaxID=265175 RepID=A0A377R3L4_9NEIS|nr:GFA family protein [Kingella potus]UOP01197.1 GFA family protein [Kingella potus]STR00901.1 Uncharacterized conserved protein [Kingella potus]
MTDTNTAHTETNARCLCGAVSLKVAHNGQVHACHCGRCRSRSGGAAFALTASEPPEISGGGNISRYRSTEWAQRAFCKQCGTDLFVQVGDDYYVNAGLFADNAAFKLEMQMFIDCKAPYYTLADDTPKMTEQEFLAFIGAAQ